jgi:hypothetical protein
MTKLAATTLAALLLLPAAQAPQDSPLKKYPAVEAYKIRRTVLAMPRYTADGQVCEVDLQPMHFPDGDVVNVDYMLDKADVDPIFDELAPPAERGAPKPPLGMDGIIVFDGGTGGTTRSFENVTLYYDAHVYSNPKKKNSMNITFVAATIKWTHRTCR